MRFRRVTVDMNALKRLPTKPFLTPRTTNVVCTRDTDERALFERGTSIDVLIYAPGHTANMTCDRQTPKGIILTNCVVNLHCPISFPSQSPYESGGS
jgi:hypothetical protein